MTWTISKCRNNEVKEKIQSKYGIVDNNSGLAPSLKKMAVKVSGQTRNTISFQFDRVTPGITL